MHVHAFPACACAALFTAEEYTSMIMTVPEEKKTLLLFLVSLHTKSILVAS